jgi:hypothetical protein
MTKAPKQRKGEAPKRELHIAHVGDVNTDRDMMFRIVSTVWLSRHRKELLAGARPTHDFIDLIRGRDFLTENNQYDVVILHFIWAGLTKGVCRDFLEREFGKRGARSFAMSPFHSPEKWRERLAATGAQVIIAFGGGGEVATAYVGTIPGYTKSEYFDPSPMPAAGPICQYVVWQREAKQ